jgi:hypothetical protein
MRVAVGQFVWVESKQLCTFINTSLEIKGKIVLTTWNIVTPPTTTIRLGGVTTLRDNNKTKAIEI